jgi:uncharacterized repeat protein (TIGR02543 family)
MKSLIFYLVILILSSSCVKKSTTTTATADTVGINAASVAKDSRSKENTKTPTLNFTYTVANSIGGSITVTNSGPGATNTAIPNITTTNTVSLAVGSTAAVTAVPATGYTFSGWTGGCVIAGASCSISLTANTQPVVATFAPIVVVAPNVSTFAGTLGVRGGANGIGANARFYHPTGLALDSADNLYISDYVNNTIRKMTPDGVVTTIAGDPLATSGHVDGIGSAARFLLPNGLAVDSSGNIFVADSWNATIRKISPNGNVTTVAGVQGSTGNNNGAPLAARFYYPCGIALDSSGNLYVGDSLNEIIRKIKL